MSRNKTDSRLVVKSSGIHGKGVFARKRIRNGSAIIEYTGEIIGEKEADRRYEDNPSTYLFMVDKKNYIDGLAGGNEARLINHSCVPNCAAYQEDDGRIVIYAIKNIQPGVELSYDYQLTDGGSDSDATSTDTTCRCGSPRCKGTMEARKKRRSKKRR